MSVKKINCGGNEINAQSIRKLNSKGVASTDPRRIAVAMRMFPSAARHPSTWLDDDIVIRLLGDMIRRVATDDHATRRGGHRREPSRQEVEAVYNRLVSRYRAPGRRPRVATV